ncbi:MAG: hypothetical protein HQL69_13225 [Magnetococcales bacterium]|nr:hypothetical protein [Magnetococcales bacterium]
MIIQFLKLYRTKKYRGILPLVFFGALSLAYFGDVSQLKSASFSVFSQNCLTLGYGDADALEVKVDELDKIVSGYDLVVLQEVMRDPDNKSEVYEGLNPGEYDFFASELQGRSSSHKEAYVFLVGKEQLEVMSEVEVFNDGDGNFERPPAGILVRSGDKYTWVLDYHAYYGSTVSDRKNEVNRIPGVLDEFRIKSVGSTNPITTDRVLIAGDWNLSADTILNLDDFVESQHTYQALPTDPSTVSNQTGKLTDSSYDHFVWDSNELDLSSIQMVYPVEFEASCNLTDKYCQEYVDTVSDHIGVKAHVGY